MKFTSKISPLLATRSKFTLSLLVLSASFVFSEDLARGKQLYDQRCSSCHGAEGKGDGPVAAALPADQRPRNLADGEKKYATDDVKFKQLLKDGGMAHGLSPMMPPQPDLSDADLDSLIKFSNSLHK